MYYLKLMKQFTNANQPGLDQNAYNEFTSCNEIVHQGNTWIIIFFIRNIVKLQWLNIDLILLFDEFFFQNKLNMLHLRMRHSKIKPGDLTTKLLR